MVLDQDTNTPGNQDFISSFTTGDFTSPRVISVTPSDGHPSASVGANVVVAFSESVNGVDATTFQLSAGGIDILSFVNLAADGKSATLVPNEPLTSVTLHKVTVTSGVYDNAFNPLDQDLNDPGNQDFTSTFTTEPLPDLSITMSDEPDPVEQGGLFRYHVTVSNIGYQQGGGAEMEVRLAPELHLIGITTTKGMCSDNHLVKCIIGDLAPGDQVTITITVRLKVIGIDSVTSRAAVDPENTVLEMDENNNLAHATTTINGGKEPKKPSRYRDPSKPYEIEPVR